MASTLDDVVRYSHHEQLPLCESRPSYRQGRKLTAVKVHKEAYPTLRELCYSAVCGNA